MFGLHLTYRELSTVKERIQQLEPENQRLKRRSPTKTQI